MSIGTNTTQAVDGVMLFILYASIGLLLLITGLMIYFAFKYNHKRNPTPTPIKEKLWLEVLWTVLPTILVLVMFWYGYEGFKVMRDVPDDAMTVKVTARMWDWSFEYDNGKKSPDKLYVPANRNVKLSLKSIDVLHSLFIPAYRIKEDLVPGQENYLWFRSEGPGTLDIYCAEFCGQKHSSMLAKLVIMEDSEFNKWLSETEEKTEEEPALALMEEFGCMDCHGMDPTPGGGLPLKGLMGATRTVLVDGVEKEITIDEAYIRRAIMEPDAEVVKGDHGLPMDVPEDITSEQLDTIVRFLKAQKSAPADQSKETDQVKQTGQPEQTGKTDQGNQTPQQESKTPESKQAEQNSK